MFPLIDMRRFANWILVIVPLGRDVLGHRQDI